jgi:type I restriction enzyme S subunit
MGFKETIVGSVPSEWNVATVDELVNSGVLYKPLDGNHGGIHPTSRDYVDSGIPFVMATDVKDGIVDLKSCKYISCEHAKTLKKGFSYEGDVLLTHKASIGRTAIVKSLTSEFIVLTPQVTYYRIKNMGKLYNEYLKYFFDSPGFQTILANWSGSGSTRAYLGITGQLKLPIILPQITEQKKIAKILTALDEKIEVNNQISKTLETMAQALFKQWFIDFEFPNENGEPYKSSGGEMIESELGLIPKGWDTCPLYDFADYINGTSFKKDEMDSLNGVPIVKIAEIKGGYSGSTNYYNGSTNKDGKYYLKKKDILFSWSGNPDTSIDIFLWGKDEGILNQHIFKVEPKGYSKSFVYLLLKSFKSTFTDIASHKQTTGLGHVTVADLKRLRVSVPPQVVLTEFIKVSDLLIDKLFNSIQEVQSLKEIRDILLPKLMSGEIRVPIENN